MGRKWPQLSKEGKQSDGKIPTANYCRVMLCVFLRQGPWQLDGPSDMYKCWGQGGYGVALRVPFGEVSCHLKYL